jgi:hypothetical protein
MHARRFGLNRQSLSAIGLKRASSCTVFETVLRQLSQQSSIWFTLAGYFYRANQGESAL